MNIQILSDDCVKISVSRRECVKYGIEYDDFTPSSDTAKMFLAMLLAKLEIMERIKTSGKITAEVFSLSNGGLIIYLSSKSISKPLKISDDVTTAVVCSSVQEVLNAAKNLKGGRLYKYMEKYVILTDEESEGGKISSLQAARIEEYGRLLCENIAERL